MKKCCKDSINWKYNGTRDKDVKDLGKAVKVTSKSYITCTVCLNRMFMNNDRTLVDAHSGVK